MIGGGVLALEINMNSDPRFWALAVALWSGFCLAALNIATKIDLLMGLIANSND
jgi:hypothetical protein